MPNQCQTDRITVAATSNRKNEAAAASIRKLSCVRSSTAAPGRDAGVVSNCGPRLLAADKKPIFGLELKIFCQAAVNVTLATQASGTRVAKQLRNLPILRSTVVAKHKAITESSWFAMPNRGHRLLMPPSGSMTP